VVFGEVGLAGEIRPAPRGQERLREAAKLGFTRAMIPEANQRRRQIPNRRSRHRSDRRAAGGKRQNGETKSEQGRSCQLQGVVV
jgi:predicted ATP-dependent serine protease